MNEQLLQAISAGTPGLIVAVSAEDLSKLVEMAAKNQSAPQTKDQPSTISAQQAMQTLGVSDTTLFRWGRDGYLVPVKVGRKNRYRTADIERILQGKGA